MGRRVGGSGFVLRRRVGWRGLARVGVVWRALAGFGGAALVGLVDAAGFFLEGGVVGGGALGVGALPGGAVGVFAVLLLVAVEAAELVEEGVGAGQEAVVVGEEAGQGRRVVGGEVGGEDFGGGVGVVVEAGVGSEVSR